MFECRERLEQYLGESRVPFEVHSHEVTYTAQETAAVEHVPGRMVAKPVIVFADGKMVMLVLGAPHRVDFHRAAEVLGVKEVRLAREDEFAGAFPDCEVGAMPPFGNLYGVPVYVDGIVAGDERILFLPGSHSETMSVSYTDFARLVGPVVAELRHPVPV